MTNVSIGAVGDLHCGGITGLFPPDFVDRAANHIAQNVVQTYLWDCWKHYCRRAWELPIRAFVINGDAVDGAQRKSGGIGVLVAPSDQRKVARMCIDYLLSGFKKKPPLYFIKGTPYHVGADGSEEEALAEIMGGQPHHGAVAGYSLRDVLNLQVGVNVLNFSHHLSYAPVNKTMPLEREINRMLLATFEGVPHADVIVRSHVHYHRLVSKGIGKPIAFTLPAWQLPTSFMFRGGGYPTPDLGAAFIHLNRKNKMETRVECQLYPTPKELNEVTVLPL